MLFDKPDFSIVDKKIPVSDARILAQLIKNALIETIKQIEIEKEKDNK